MADYEAKEESCVMKRVISLSELILGFFENGEANPEINAESSNEELSDFGEQQKVFWESQHRILEVECDTSFIHLDSGMLMKVLSFFPRLYCPKLVLWRR